MNYRELGPKEPVQFGDIVSMHYESDDQITLNHQWIGTETSTCIEMFSKCRGGEERRTVKILRPISEPSEQPCEICGKPAEGRTSDDVHLCTGCGSGKGEIEAISGQSANEQPKTDCDEDEDLIQNCIEYIRGSQPVSIPSLQKRFRIGYTRASALMVELERRKLVKRRMDSDPWYILAYTVEQPVPATVELWRESFSP